MPEHVSGADVLRHLIDRRCTEDVPGSEHSQEGPVVKDTRHGVNCGVAQIHPNRVGSVLFDDGGQSFVDDGEGVTPCRLAMTITISHQGASQPVGVGLDSAEGGALGTDVPAAEDIFSVTSDPLHLAVGVAYLQSAGCLAERACPVAGQLLGFHQVISRHRRGRVGTRFSAKTAALGSSPCGGTEVTSRVPLLSHQTPGRPTRRS